MSARLLRESVAFLQCDIQEVFRPLIYNMPAVIFTATQMAKFAGLFRIPLVVSDQYPQRLGSTVEELRSVAPAEHYYFAKNTFSMVNDALLDRLRGIDSVVLYGIEAHVCVQQSCLDLLSHHKQVFILADGVSSQRTLDRTASLERMRQAGAVVTTFESAIFDIMRSTDFPEFKGANALLKNKPTDPLTHL
jgi:nicotinamidase-related amidase